MSGRTMFSHDFDDFFTTTTSTKSDDHGDDDDDDNGDDDDNYDNDNLDDLDNCDTYLCLLTSWFNDSLPTREWRSTEINNMTYTMLI